MWNSVNEILKTFAAGEFVIIFDEHRECEGDFFVLAQTITPQKINFLLKKARGQICVACAPEILDTLKIPLLTQKNENPHGTNFTMPVDATNGISTGVSAFDRAKTIQVLASPDSKSTDLVRPGHTFPLRSQNISDRFGHTEAAVELVKTINTKLNLKLIPSVVICEILDEDGGKASLEFLQKIFLKIPMISLEEVRKAVGKI